MLRSSFSAARLLLSILHYRAANCSCTAAPSYVGVDVECLAALYKALGILLAIYCEYIICIGQFALYDTTSIIRGCSAFAFLAVPHYLPTCAVGKVSYCNLLYWRVYVSPLNSRGYLGGRYIISICISEEGNSDKAS